MDGDERQTPADPVVAVLGAETSGGWSATEAGLRGTRSLWFRRHLAIGVALGAGLGLVGQGLVAVLAPGEHDATGWQRLAGIGYSTGAWVVIAFAVALIGAALWRRGRGRALAVGLSVTVLGGLAFVSALGSALRVVSGSYLTAGAVAFSLGSADHFVHAALEGYVGWFAITMAVMVLFALAIHRALRRTIEGDQRVAPQPERQQLAIVLALLTALTIVYVRRADHRFTKRMFLSAPLLALASSFDTDFDLDRTSMRGPIGEPLAPPGPPRSKGEAWERRIAALAEDDAERPNVLLVVLESVAVSHLSTEGYRRRTTPNLERLAQDGLYMERGWTTATHSNYAQMAILSSLFPRRVHGLDQYERLDYPRVLFHDVFHRLGYDTATITSQDENWQGMRRFQETGTPTFFWFSDTYEGEHLDSGVEKIVPDEDTTEVVLDWLSTFRRAPWALYLNFQATHFPYTLVPDADRPWTPDRPTMSTFGYLGYPHSEHDVVVNRYDNALRYVDEQLGRIVDYLDAADELDDTLIVVTADHGEMFFEKGLVTHGKTLFEVEARVPILVHWRGRVAPQRRRDPVSNLDVMPTIAEIVGFPAHPSWQGRSFVSPPPDLRPPAVFMNIQGLRFADAIVCWPYKLILERTSERQHLFDLSRDPAENADLIEEQPEIAARLADTLSKQLLAQLDYHREQAVDLREARFQPRLRSCPDLAGARR